jgi:TPR repeat protein
MRRSLLALSLIAAACSTKKPPGPSSGAASSAPAGAAAPDYQKLTADCDRGTAQACETLGSAILGGKAGAPKDLAAGEAALARACEQLKSAGACSSLELRARQGHLPGGEDWAKSTKYAGLACDLGRHDACATLGYRYLGGKGVTADKAKARSLFESSCDQGVQFACVQMALFLKNGTFDATGERDLAYYRKRSCDLGAAEMCEKKP